MLSLNRQRQRTANVFRYNRVLLAAMLLWLSACQAEPRLLPIEQFPLKVIYLDCKPLQVRIAATERHRNQGLMQQAVITHGMLFIQDTPSQAAPMAFWMKNTLLDLDIAFIDPQHRIQSIHRMQAHSTDIVHSNGPVLMALEMPAGYFSQQAIAMGTTVGWQPANECSAVEN